MCCGKLIDPKKTNILTSKKYCNDCEESYQCAGCKLISVKHAKTRVPFMVHRYWNKVKQYGDIDCIIANYLWDVEAKCCISKNSVCEIDRTRYKPLTRERLLSLNEVCCTV